MKGKRDMPKQIRGIILEGQSCSGKSSVFNALKRLYVTKPDIERNIIFLTEQYSQTLNLVHGKLQRLSREENMKVLSDRISMLEQLNNYANEMGEHTRRSRGLFFVFERFHLNYAHSFNDIQSIEYVDIERRISKLNALTVLCVISPDKMEQRLLHRSTFTGDPVTKEIIAEYAENQQRLIDLTQKSSAATLLLNTDEMDWDRYAKDIFNRIKL
jgi:hypothetical protein